MILLGGGIVWAGFTLMWWGRNRGRGCSTSFRELVVPGAYKGCSNAGGSGDGRVLDQPLTSDSQRTPRGASRDAVDPVAAYMGRGQTTERR